MSPSPSQPSIDRPGLRFTSPTTSPSNSPAPRQAPRNGGSVGTGSRSGFRSEAPQASGRDHSGGQIGFSDLRDGLPTKQVERNSRSGGDGRARIPESGRPGSVGSTTPTGTSWRDLRTHEIVQRNAANSRRNGEQGRASIPENSFSSNRRAVDGGRGITTQPDRTAPLERLPRRLPTQHDAGRPDSVAPNTGSSNWSGSVHANGWSAPPCNHPNSNVGFFFGVPGCRFPCWHGWSGCEFGYVF